MDELLPYSMLQAIACGNAVLTSMPPGEGTLTPEDRKRQSMQGRDGKGEIRGARGEVGDNLVYSSCLPLYYRLLYRVSCPFL